MKNARINITTVVNKGSIRRETRNGREVIIVSSATLPDNVVMNGIMYPAEEIEKGFRSLDRKPAPFNHPSVNGEYVSALDPEGINQGWIGAWNENVRRENGRVHLDKVIDVKRAESTEDGKRVLDALNTGKPIHTSTGLLCNLEDAGKGKGYSWRALNMEFDHDAILLDMPGAATPEQGVGIFVNSEGKAERVEVFNSFYEGDSTALDEGLVRSFFENLKSALLGPFGGKQAVNVTNQKETEMSAEEISKLATKVDALATTVSGMPEVIGNAIAKALEAGLKPVVDAHNASAAAAQAAADAEKAELVTKVVKANMLTEAAAKEAPLTTLKALAANIKAPAASPRVTNAFGNGEGEASGFKLPKAS